MIDIVEANDGQDLGIADTVAPRASNLCSTQVGSLEYAPDFGVDLKFFLQENLQFQNESFKAYLVEQLSKNQINVVDVLEVVEDLATRYTFSVGDPYKSEGLIA